MSGMTDSEVFQDHRKRIASLQIFRALLALAVVFLGGAVIRDYYTLSTRIELVKRHADFQLRAVTERLDAYDRGTAALCRHTTVLERGDYSFHDNYLYAHDGRVIGRTGPGECFLMPVPR